jgi:hypothetical protein
VDCVGGLFFSFRGQTDFWMAKLINIELPIQPIDKATFSLEDLAEYLAHAVDETQGQFFNEFVQRLRMCCQPHMGWQMQGLMLKKYLNDDAKDFFNFVGVDDV